MSFAPPSVPRHAPAGQIVLTKTPRYEVRVRVLAPVDPTKPIGPHNRMELVDLLLKCVTDLDEADDFLRACRRTGKPPAESPAHTPARAVMEAVVAMSTTPDLLVQEFYVLCP